MKHTLATCKNNVGLPGLRYFDNLSPFSFSKIFFTSTEFHIICHVYLAKFLNDGRVENRPYILRFYEVSVDFTILRL